MHQIPAKTVNHGLLGMQIYRGKKGKKEFRDGTEAEEKINDEHRVTS